MTKFEEKIKEIIHKIGKISFYSNKNATGDPVAIYYTESDIAKEIASLYEGWYPGEFVMWMWFGNHPFVQWYDNADEYFWTDEIDEKKWTLPDLYLWWQGNVEGK